VPTQVNDSEFIEASKKLKSASKVSEFFKMDVRAIRARRRTIEIRYGISLPSESKGLGNSWRAQKGQILDKIAEHRSKVYKHVMDYELHDGVVLVASDAHYWPGIVTPGHEAFCKLAKQ